jgi:hypothetical protein
MRGLFTPRLILRRGADQLAYLTRWGIRTRWFSIFVHRFDGPDPGNHLHDHPWWFVSLILRGGYTELRAPIDSASMRARMAAGGRWPVTPGRKAEHRRFGLNVIHMDTCHTITDVTPGTLTLVVTGPRHADKGWGFYTPWGYVPHGSYEHEDRSLVAEYPSGLSDSERAEYEQAPDGRPSAPRAAP